MIPAKRLIPGGQIQIFGSVEGKNILVFIGRDNFVKDKVFFDLLVEHFANDTTTVILYEPICHAVVQTLNLGARWQWIPKRVQRVIRAIRLLFCPAWWPYFLPSYQRDCLTIPFRCRNFKRFLQSLRMEKNITVISRSAGGRISSLIADELKISRLICLGYPFKHPERPVEPERYEHLKTLQTPFLILQGKQDSYGGLNVAEQYPRSSQVALEFMDTDHDYGLSESGWKMVLDRIATFISTTKKSLIS